MKRSLRNFLYVFTGDGLSRLLGFVVVTYLARTLGVENMGLIGFAMAALSYALVVGDLGLPRLGTREIAKDRTQVAAYVAGVLVLRVMLAMIAFTALAVFALVIPKPLPARLMVLVYAFSLLPAGLLLDWVFQGTEQMEYISLSKLLLYVTYLVLVLAFVRGPGDVLRVPVLWLVANAVGSGYLLFAYRVRFGPIHLSFNLRFWNLLLQAGLPIGLGTVLSQFYMNFGLIALGLISTDEATGLFTAALRLTFFVLIIDRLFFTVVFPVVARRLAAAGKLTPGQARESSRATMEQLARLILIIAVPVALCGSALALPVTTLVYGEAFAGAGVMLVVLLWLVVTTTLNSLYAYGLIAVGREKEYARNVAIGLFSVAALSLPLVHRLGGLGAAIALVAGELVMLGFMLHGFSRVVPVSPALHLGRPLLVSLALAWPLWHFPPARVAGWLPAGLHAGLGPRVLEAAVLAGLVMLAIAIYVGIMYLVGGIGKTELALLRDRES